MFARPMVDLAESKEWMPPKIVRDNTKDQLNDGASDSQLGARTRNHVGCMMHDQSKSLLFEGEIGRSKHILVRNGSATTSTPSGPYDPVHV